MTKDRSLGGYISAHGCPPVLLGSDGVPYTVEILADASPQESGRFGAAVLFVKWSDEQPRPVGHLETEYLTYGDTSDSAKRKLEGLDLREMKRYLDRLIEERKGIVDW